MTRKRSAIEADLSTAGLSPNCRKVIDYWLSLWQGDALPAREAFQPTKLGKLLRNVMLFDVVPDKSVHVRLAGTGLTSALGVELTGMDWLATVTGERREQRLKDLSRIARGAIAITTRTITFAHGEQQNIPEIALPFRPPADGAPIQVLFFVDWFTDNLALKLASAAEGIKAPISTSFIPLHER